MTPDSNIPAGWVQPLLPFAVFDEFGKPANDRVQDYGRACADAVLNAAPKAPAEEQGWLIESKFTGAQTTWWNGRPEGAGVSFTTDPNEAVRFPREEDAERVAQHMHMVKVTEHIWLSR